MKFIVQALALLVSSVLSEAIRWTTPLPVGYSMLAGDLVKIPIDDFVNLKGATFYISPIMTPNPLINKIQPVAKDVDITNLATAPQGTMSKCGLSFRVNDKIYLLCSSRWLYRLNLNFKSYSMAGAHDLLELNNPNFNVGDQFCSDMFENSGKLFVLCINKKSTTSHLYFYMIDTLASVWTNQVVYTTCETSGHVLGYPVMAMVPFTTTSTSGLNYGFVVYDQTPPQTIPPPKSSLNFARCIPSNNLNGTNHYKDLLNAQDLSGNSSLTGSIRYVQYLTSSELMYMVGQDTGGATPIRQLAMGVFAIDSNGVISRSTMLPGLAFWGNSTIDSFSPVSIIGYTWAINSNSVVVIDNNNLYYLPFQVNRGVAPNVITFLGDSWIVPFDCGGSDGLPTTTVIFPAHVSHQGLNINQYDSRLLVEFRINNADYDVRDFRVHFNSTKYGCSKASGYGDVNTQNSATLIDSNIAISFKANYATFFTLNQDTLLSFKVVVDGSNPAGNRSLSLTANVITSSPTPVGYLNYSIFAKAEDINEIRTGLTSFKTYSGGKLSLPLPRSSFVCNTPKYSTDPTPPKVTSFYSSVYQAPNASNANGIINLGTSGWNMQKVYAVDSETFVVVVKKPNTADGFAIIKPTFNADGQPIFPTREAARMVMPQINQFIFKAARLGKFVCVFYKEMVATNRFGVTCVQNSMPAQVTDSYVVGLGPTYLGITMLQELQDVVFYETSGRLDLLCAVTDSSMGNGVQGQILYGSISLSSDGQSINTLATPFFNQLNINLDPVVSGYFPMDLMYDFWGDTEGTNYITIKMVGFNKPPILARFSLIFNSGIPTIILNRVLSIDDKNVVFCVSKNEIVIYNPKARSIFSQKWDRANLIGTSQTRFYFPILDYGISQIIQFNCIPERGLFQILGKGMASGTAFKKLLTFRGGESVEAGNRVHSVENLSLDVEYIDSAFTMNKVVTVASAAGSNTKLSNVIYTYVDGPIFYVDNTNQQSNYAITIKQTNSKSTPDVKQISFNIEILNPTYFASVSAKRKFPITVGTDIQLENESNINGPVMDIQLSGSDSQNVKVIKRNNLFKGYNPSTQTSNPDKLMVEKDFMVLVYNSGTTYAIEMYGDPFANKDDTTTSPTMMGTAIPMGRDAVISTTLSDSTVVVVTKIFNNNEFQYNIHVLEKVTTTGAAQYTKTDSMNLFSTKIDYNQLQAVYIDGVGMVAAMSNSKDFSSNYIKLVYFNKGQNNIYTKSSEAMVMAAVSREISHFSLVHNGDSTKPRAIIVGHYTSYPGMVVANWDLVSNEALYITSNTPFPFSATDSRLPTFNYLKCWPVTTAQRKADCFLDTEGVVDYRFEITFNDPQTAGDPIASAVKTAEFEQPPMFEIKKIDKTDESVGFLLQRTELLPTGATLGGDKYSDCNNILAIFRPRVSRFIYTAISCTEFGNNALPNIDMAMENKMRDYILFTKPQTQADPSKVRVDYLSYVSVSVLKQIDPSQVILKFVGLNGASAPENKQLSLKDFSDGSSTSNNSTPESSTSIWTYVLIVGCILALGAGGFVAYTYFTGNSSSGSYSSPSKNQLTSSFADETL